MNEALKGAIKCAEYGWYVFPILPGLKIPYKGFSWPEKSTNDIAQIKKAGESKKYTGCNWAIDLGKSNLFVIDIDSYKPGVKEALAKLPEEQFNDLIKSRFIVQTPQTGKHYYHKGRGPNSESDVCLGVDTKSAGGYVLAPGSVNGNGRPYELISKGPLPGVPKWISEQLRGSGEKKANRNDVACELDLTHNVDSAIGYLRESAPEAVEGSGGDNTTYEVACRVRDFGLSESMALEVMLDHWNNVKAFPPWGVDELGRKVRNAYTYARDRVGNDTAEALFPEIRPESSSLFMSFREVRMNRRPPRWIVKRYIEQETVNVWFGDPGNYKSFLALDLAVAVATGQMWGGESTNPGAVFYLAGEGHGGLARRVEACCAHRGIPLDKFVPAFLSKMAVPLTSEQIVAKVLEDIRGLKHKVRLVIIDTLAANFGPGDENSTKDMSEFIRLVNVKIRQPLGCAVLICHHSGHDKKHRSRGSSALEAGVDAHSRIDKDENMVCIRRPKKMKDAEPFPDLWFEAEKVQLGLDEDLRPITSLVVNYKADYEESRIPRRLGKNQSLILMILSEKGFLTKNDLKNEFKNAREEDGETFTKQTFYKTLDDLVNDGLVIEKKEKFGLGR